MSDSGSEQNAKPEPGAAPGGKRKGQDAAATPSPKKRMTAQTPTTAGEVGTGDPEVALFIVRELLDACSKETRERAAREFGLDPKKLHNLWSKRMKDRLYKQFEQAVKK